MDENDYPALKVVKEFLDAGGTRVEICYAHVGGEISEGSISGSIPNNIKGTLERISEDRIIRTRIPGIYIKEIDCSQYFNPKGIDLDPSKLAICGVIPQGNNPYWPWLRDNERTWAVNRLIWLGIKTLIGWW